MIPFRLFASVIPILFLVCPVLSPKTSTIFRYGRTQRQIDDGFTNEVGNHTVSSGPGILLIYDSFLSLSPSLFYFPSLLCPAHHVSTAVRPLGSTAMFSAYAVTETSSDSTTTAPIVLEEPSPEKAYKNTAYKHWGTLQQNMTLTTGDALPMDDAPDGPFGFGMAAQLDGTTCLKDLKFWKNSDACLQSPLKCPQGISVSIWYKGILKEKLEDVSEEKQYILSSGGDEDGHPGFAIYTMGHYLHFLVSTGEEVWHVRVLGQVYNSSWCAIGLRWNKAHGLEGYRNIEKVATAKYPTSKPDESKKEDYLDPTEIMVGCHKTKANDAYRDFAAGCFDEMALWTRRLPDNETSFFLGGYKSDFANATTEELALILKQVDLTDASQSAAAVALMVQVTHVEEMPTTDPTSAPTAASSTSSQTTTSSSTAATPTAVPVVTEGAKKSLVDLLDIMGTLLQPGVVPPKMSLKDTASRSDALQYASNLIVDSKTPSWKALSADDETVFSTFLTRVERISGTWAANTDHPNGSDPVTVIKETPNIVMRFDMMTVKDLQEFEPQGVHPEYVHFPKFNTDPRLQATKDKYSPIDSVAVPNMLISDPRCEDRNTFVKFMYYPSLRSIADMTVSEADLRPDRKYEIDSAVMSITIRVLPRLDENGAVDPSAPPCDIDKSVTEKTPFRFKMGHKSQTRSRATLRKLMFHEDEEIPTIQKRYCVYWNKDIGDNGGWDTSGCKVLNTSAEHTKCACTHPGIYTILAEKVEHPSVSEELTWLKFVKYTGYGISALALVIYIALVAVSGDLKEQFHLMGLNLCVAVLVGSVLMVLSDLESIRSDRHTCTMWGSLLQVFYLAAGVWVGMLGHAAFKAITAGIIGGRLKGYWLMSWGIPLISMGLTYLLHLHDLGTDPRCFISWENNVRWYFFGPMMFFTVIAFIFGLIVLCNMSTPALRKDNLIEDYGSFCRGAALVMIYFLLTWGFGLPAYIRFQEKGVVDFYPIFQVLNAFSGLIIFLFIGIASKRFRMILAGKAKARRQMLFGQAFGLPNSSKMDPADQRTSSTVSTAVPSESTTPNHSNMDLRSPSCAGKVAGRPHSN